MSVSDLITLVAMWNAKYSNVPMFCLVEKWQVNWPASIGVDIIMRIGECRTGEVECILVSTHLVAGRMRQKYSFGLEEVPVVPANVVRRSAFSHLKHKQTLTLKLQGRIASQVYDGLIGFHTVSVVDKLTGSSDIPPGAGFILKIYPNIVSEDDDDDDDDDDL